MGAFQVRAFVLTSAVTSVEKWGACAEDGDELVEGWLEIVAVAGLMESKATASHSPCTKNRSW